MTTTDKIERLIGGKVIKADSVDIEIEMPDGKIYILTHYPSYGDSFFELYEITHSPYVRRVDD